MKELIVSKWNEILSLLETEYDVSSIIINTWIRSLEVYSYEDNKIYFAVNERFGQKGVNYICQRSYDVYLLSIIRYVLNNPDIDIVIDEKSNFEGVSNVNTVDNTSYNDAVNRSNLNPKYTFETFIVGDSNRHAHATCLAVADLPSQDNFNPLFLYGGAGLGKTHLMQAIAHYILLHNDKTNVLYVTSETFTNEIIEAIKNNKTESFRSKYRNVDVLLIDDIQFIIGRESTQQEFFNTFNFLYEAKKQIILSSDKPPKEIKVLEERIRSRLEWGVPIDIHAPDYETRMAILKNKAEIDGLNNIPEEVFKYISENITSNIRELEGALNKISIYSNLMKVQITEELASEILKDLIYKDTEVNITPDLIINIVGEHLAISSDDIKSAKRSKDIATARQIVMYLCRKYTSRSLKSIGDSLGGKDHTTIMNGINRIENKIKNNADFKATIKTIIKKINPSE